MHVAGIGTGKGDSFGSETGDCKQSPTVGGERELPRKRRTRAGKIVLKGGDYEQVD